MHTNYSLSYSSFHFLQRKVYDLGHHHKSVHVRRIRKGYLKFQESSDRKRTDLAAETIVQKTKNLLKIGLPVQVYPHKLQETIANVGSYLCNFFQYFLHYSSNNQKIHKLHQTNGKDF